MNKKNLLYFKDSGLAGSLAVEKIIGALSGIKRRRRWFRTHTKKTPVAP